MKNTFFTLICLITLNGIAQKPEKIYGNARQNKPLSYYKEQSIAWKKVLDANPKDAVAWYNYYYANRNIMFNDTVATHNPKEKSDQLLKVVDDMEKQIPNSYEYNMARWQLGGNNPKFLPYLKKAVELGEGRTEHLDYMINQGELGRNTGEREMYSLKKFDAGSFSSGIIYYNYNVLAGLEKNAILVTSGDNDTYPIWFLQARGFRKDVTVLNMSLILIDDYREKLFNELGIEKWQKPTIAEMTEAEYQRYRDGIITHIANNKKKFPVSLALTTACDDKYIKSIKENLYLTGLSYLYSKESVDNIALLKNNVENVYAFDYLDKPFYTEISPDMVKMINGNYIVPLLTLYDHYKLAGDTSKSEWVKSKLLLITKGTESETEVLKHLAVN